MTISALRRRRLVRSGVTLFVVLAIAVTAFVALGGTRAASHVVEDVAVVFDGPFEPDRDDGYVPAGEYVGLYDDHPTITKLDPELLDAVRRAAADLEAEQGIEMLVTTGWRSLEYQQWLFDEAVERYRDEEIAKSYVASPDVSKHPQGEAIDIGPLDAQLWLQQHGSDYGLCQTYSNERWHYELATSPGGECPPMLQDARYAT